VNPNLFLSEQHDKSRQKRDPFGRLRLARSCAAGHFGGEVDEIRDERTNPIIEIRLQLPNDCVRRALCGIPDVIGQRLDIVNAEISRFTTGLLAMNIEARQKHRDTE
jgi:hypothetical protein